MLWGAAVQADNPTAIPSAPISPAAPRIGRLAQIEVSGASIACVGREVYRRPEQSCSEVILRPVKG
jgi:hypothetical protein